LREGCGAEGEGGDERGWCEETMDRDACHEGLTLSLKSSAVAMRDGGPTVEELAGVGLEILLLETALTVHKVTTWRGWAE